MKIYTETSDPIADSDRYNDAQFKCEIEFDNKLERIISEVESQLDDFVNSILTCEEYDFFKQYCVIDVKEK